MELGLPFRKKADTCEIHGASTSAANRTLLLMIAACSALIIWHVWTFGPSGHSAAGASADGFFPLLLWGEVTDLAFNSHGILAELWDILPYFLVGLLLGGYLRTYKVAMKLQASLRRYGVTAVFLASFVGIITPLCACGTLTTAISLLFAGLPLAPVMALLVTSPLLSPSAFLLTLNDLGPEWTVIRTITAYVFGVFAGLTVHFLRNRGFQTKELFIEGAIVRGDFHDDDYPDERLRCNCRGMFGNRVAVRTGNKFLVLLAKSAEMGWPIGKYVLVGVIVGSIVERYMPYQWIYRLFGSHDPLSIVWVTLGSVPLFLHQISASSILAHIKGSLHGTLDAGAALAFIIGGPVTAVPTLALFWSVFKKRVFVLYLAICISGTLLISYGARALVFIPGVDMGNPLFKGVGHISAGPSAVIEKIGGNVRIILDVDSRKTIAVADGDAVEGQGGIVFDAAYDRIKNTARLDNLVYLVNAAQWLEPVGFGAGKRILVYDVCGGEGCSKLNLEPLRRAVQKAGLSLDVVNRSPSVPLSDSYLADYSQAWIIFGENTLGGDLKDNEIKALWNLSASGRGMLIVAGNGEGSRHDMSAVNRLTGNLGVKFSGYDRDHEEIRVAKGAGFYRVASSIIERILKIFHKA
jgi:uncharacterized membrane protein YraQ (UPF0718 family)